MKKEATAALVVKNVERDIQEIIERLLDQTYPKDKYEILIIDTGSTDNTFSILSRYKNRIRVMKTRASVGKARYLAFKHARGDVVLLTDGDVIPPKNFISRIMIEFKKDESVVAVQWPSKTRPAKGFIYRCMAAFWEGLGMDAKRNLKRGENVDGGKEKRGVIYRVPRPKC
jgi:cellulose synthase/poly-beta-1,6-N-acetylglucosamine synthase-like glycosyltransferase